MEIDQSVFDHWIREPLTQRLMEIMRENEEGAKELILNPEIIFEQDSHKRLAYLAGMRKVYQDILNLSLEDFLEEKEEENNE